MPLFSGACQPAVNLSLESWLLPFMGVGRDSTWGMGGLAERELNRKSGHVDSSRASREP